MAFLIPVITIPQNRAKSQKNLEKGGLANAD